MKKLFLTMFMLLLTLGLVACTDTTNPNDDNNDNDDNDDITRTITLSYADWGDQDFNQRMIDLFEAAHPNVEVTLRTDIEGTGEAFTGNLVLAAQAGILPDVYVTDNVPTVVNSGLTLDTAQYWDADPDTALVYENIAQTAVYNNKRLALPSFQFLKGIMINLDIFEAANLTTVEGQYRIDNDGYPVKDWTFDEFVNIAKAITNFTGNPADTVVGLDTWYGTPDFQQVWPMMNDADVMYDTWDGTEFNYNSADWIYAMQEKVELQALTNGTLVGRYPASIVDAMAEETYDGRYDFLYQYLIQTGYGAMDIEGSWQFWVINDAAANDINLGFWPYPSGTAGLFPPTILDYICVSSQTDYPEMAYELAKWMSFGSDGWDARLTLLETDRDEAIANSEIPPFLDRFPVADYAGIWTRVEALVEGVEGIDAIFNRIEYSKPDLDKWLPGYKDFWAWVNDPVNNPYSWEALLAAGPSAVATFAVEWEAAANRIVQAQITTLGQDPE